MGPQYSYENQDYILSEQNAVRQTKNLQKVYVYYRLILSLVLVLLYLLNPVIAHATVRSALRTGLKPRGRDDDDLLV